MHDSQSRVRDLSGKPSPSNVDDFFLPDLCRPQALFVLVLLAELLSVVVVLIGSGLDSFSWSDFSLVSLFLLWSTLASAGLLCVLRPALAQLPLPLAASGSYLLVLLVVGLSAAAGQWLTRGLGQPHWHLDISGLMETLLVAAVVAGIGLRYAYLTRQLQLRQQGELSAKLEVLQARIRPHFLFNSLNSIASLVATQPQDAEQAVEDLAALFRASLREIRAEVSWAEERELCKSYLRIEALRLGPRLKTDWQVDGLPDTLMMPSLSLQPLLENAIVHGIAELPEGGTVEVRGWLAAAVAHITVSNPLADGAVSGGNQMAMDNIHHRLQALYGESAGLQARVENGRYVAEIILPQRQEAS